jgi:hypothetical protein|tara:strand:+ start:1877 stop:2047 length:171 start_codon:yes stop_codon:yes gene_type:complete
MDKLKINRGIELMLRGAKKKEEKDEKPSKGFAITRFFTLLKRRVYFNLELWWERQD